MFLDRFARASVIAAGVFLLPACGGGGSAASVLPTTLSFNSGGSSNASNNVVATAPPLVWPAHARPTPVGKATQKPTSPPASTPSQAPTPVPATPQPQFGSRFAWSNGQQIPASFALGNFGASGPLYQALPASPQLDPNSANAVSYYFAGNSAEFPMGWIDADKSQAQYDYNFPIYVAAASDPLVTIICSHASPAVCADGGVQIHMPALAQQAGGGDHHLAVLQPDGTEYDFWLVDSNPPYAAGSRFSAAGEGHYAAQGAVGANAVAPGFDVGSATAGGIALTSGQIYASELAAGVINHAISLLFPCSTSAWVYPASQTTGTCANGQGMPLGSRVWWQPSDTQTAAMALPRDMKTVLVALHHYGGFFTDNGAGSSNINGSGVGMGAHLENQEPYWIYGGGNDPALNYAASAPGWNHIKSASVNRYALVAEGSAVDFLHNLKILAPCVTQQSC